MIRRFIIGLAVALAAVLSANTAAAEASPTVERIIVQPRHTDDGSGWGFCVGSVPPPGWTCP